MKRVIGILLSVVMIVALLPVMPMRSSTTGVSVSYVFYASQADAIAGITSTATQECIGVNPGSGFNSGDPGSPIWYAVTHDITFSERITVLGDVRIILCDNTTLTAQKGITVADDDNDPSTVSPNSLTIYCQAEGSGNGKLIAESETDETDNNNAAIGGTDRQGCGTITINGGIVEATASATATSENEKSHSNGAGIGGGANGNGGKITINGGKITATATATSENGNSYSNGAGIGGGSGNGDGNSGNGGNITINGGNVTAKSLAGTWNNASGIGGGSEGSGGTITINGGEINALSKADSCADGAGIGGGIRGDGGTITINGGEINALSKADSNADGAGIGGGYNADGGNITINGGKVTATATATATTLNNDGCFSCGAGIGGGQSGNGGDITINGGEVKATADANNGENATSHGAGIGGGIKGNGGNITITGGEVTAIANSTHTAYGAGIGGGYEGSGGNITINGGEVKATADANNGENATSYGAGIGGGHNADGGNITITGGDITASGGLDADGIGRGQKSYSSSATSGSLALGDGVFLYGSGESQDDIYIDGNPSGNINEGKKISADPGSNPPSYPRLRFMKVISFINTVKLKLTKPSIGTSISTTEESPGEYTQNPAPSITPDGNANYRIEDPFWYDTLPDDPTDPNNPKLPMNGTIHAGTYYVKVDLYLVPNCGSKFNEERNNLVFYLNGARVDGVYVPNYVSAEGCTVFIPVTITAPPVEQYCTITYNSNGGTGSMDPEKVKKGSPVRVDYCDFKKKGYAFVSWNTQQDGTGISYNEGQLLKLNTNLYLYAQWIVSISDAKITLNPKSKSREYDGKTHKIEVTSVVLDGKTLIPGTDYIAPDVKVKKVKTYEIVVTGIGDYAGKKIIQYKVSKGDNTLKTANAKITAKCKVNAKTNKTSDSVKVPGIKIKNKGQGKITFKKVSVDKNAGHFKVDKNTGKITVYNSTKIGTYKVTVSAQAAGNKSYNKSKLQKRVVKITLKSK